MIEILCKYNVKDADFGNGKIDTEAIIYSTQKAFAFCKDEPTVKVCQLEINKDDVNYLAIWHRDGKQVLIGEED